MTTSAFAQDRAADVSATMIAAHPAVMSDPKLWHLEYEAMLIDEAVRRGKRIPKHDRHTWTVVSQMTPAERRFVLALVAIGRVFEWLRRRMRL